MYDATLSPPSKLFLIGELRIFGEIGTYYLAYPFMRYFPHGKKNPVLVFPGLAGDDTSTWFLRRLLKRLGYRAHGWKLGRNLIGPELKEKTEERLRELYFRYHQKVSLIGQSLGGVYARELARKHPDMVKQVITLGSPINGNPTATNVWAFYQSLTGIYFPQGAFQQFKERLPPPPVPCTAVYSKTDGIVSWKCTVESQGHLTENIQIESSHFGMAVNPFSLYIIADRLAQQENCWKPFERKSWKKIFYPKPVVPNSIQ